MKTRTHQIKSIVSGIKHYSLKDKVTEELARSRAEICVDCPQFKKVKPLQVIKDGAIKEIQGSACSACGCALSLKTRSKNEKCPLDKW